MRTLIIMVTALTLSICFLDAQTINWAGLKDDHRSMVNANLGFEYGFIYGFGYDYQFKTWVFPAVASLEISSPLGENQTDDFKIKIGGKIRWYEFHDFQISTNISGVFRRNENGYVRMVNFGSDLACVAGYYRPHWFVSGEVGFDKAIVSQYKHSDSYSEQFPGVKDGWYVPSMGGNFYYGVQAGFSLGATGINLSTGRVLTQDFRTKPMIPYYAKLGFNHML